MKLSIAMRRGSKLREASERGWNDIGPNGELRSCALMAAAEAAGLFMVEDGAFVMGPYGVPSKDSTNYRSGGVAEVTVQAPPHWETLLERMELPPCLCAEHGGEAQVIILIWHLHDMHRWSREAVAEWIEMLEGNLEHKDVKTQQPAAEFA